MLDTMGARHLLTAECDLTEAEPYGACLTFGPGHYEIWKEWRRRGPPNVALAEVVRDDEYEEWPRGRVVFDEAANRFMLYADRRITAEGLADEVARHFGLPSERVVVQHDLHYQSTRAIKARA